MVRVTIQEAEASLSVYLEQVSRGEVVVLCHGGKDIAEIKSVQSPTAHKRPIGLAKGTFQIPESFFAPLPPDLSAAFQGES